MVTPLVSRLALDAQEAFVAAVDLVPPQFREQAPVGLNPASWVITHAAGAHQVWIGAYVGDQARDPWFDSIRLDQPSLPRFADAREALRRVTAQTTAVLTTLTESDLSRLGSMADTSFLVGWTVGQLLARSVAHLYVHAADLNVLVVLGGGDDLGLPRAMSHTRISP